MCVDIHTTGNNSVSHVGVLQCMHKAPLYSHVCMHTARVRINRVRLPIPLLSPEKRKLTLPCRRTRLRMWPRETGSAVPSRVSLLISIPRLNLVLTYEIPRDFRTFIYLNRHTLAVCVTIHTYPIGSVPSLSGHAIAYRWRSLPRVRRHRASEPQGSSKRVLPWQVTIYQLICTSFSHTHYT